jgi:O-antigen ligase
LIGWIVLAAAVSGGSAKLPLAIILGSAASFGLGMLAATRWGGRSAVLLVVLGAVLLVWAWPEIAARRPLGRPFGYANATAAFFVQVLAASLVLRRALNSRGLKLLTGVAATVFAAVPLIVGSTTGTLCVAVVLAAGLIGAPFGSRRHRSRWIAALGAAFLIVLVGTLTLGARVASTPLGGSGGGVAGSVLSPRRLELWSDAIDLVQRRPLFGVGVGRFEQESPVARSDRDARRAHHEFLQMSAETGVVGGLLLVAMFVWAIVRLGVSSGIDGGNGGDVIVAAAVATLAIHASVDYVLHFALVPMSATFLVGIRTRRH